MKQERFSKSPPHYRALSLRNFRGFKKQQDIPLAPLTFLVGPNSAGKSSLFDALLLVAQSQFSASDRSQVPNWSGPLVDLGAFRDCVYRHDSSLAIEIGVELSPHFRERDHEYRGIAVDQAMKISFELRTSSDDPVGRLSSMTIKDVVTDEYIQLKFAKTSVAVKLMDSVTKWPPKTSRYISFFSWLRRDVDKLVRRRTRTGKKAAWQRIMRTLPLGRINGVIRFSERVSSGRSAPRRWYSVAETTFEYGRSQSRVFSAVEPMMLRRSPYYYRRGDLKTSLSSILAELEIGDHLHDSKLSPYHIAISIRDSITGITSNLIDVGYGASQVIPVLWACLSNSWAPLFIEQPEIHLHPKAQGTLADFICETSRRRQVIVETHSVHMINRARIMIAQGKLPPGHVVVNYVDRKRDGSHVHTIPILDNGDFGGEWPDGFFDERYEDTMFLLKLKSQKGT
jgi:hypothetical protein